MSGARIEKTAVEADLYMADGLQVTGLVYVEPGMSRLSAMQTLLVGDQRLIPFRGESGELVFIGRKAISALRFEYDGDVPSGLEASIRMKTTLAGRHELEGVLHLPDTGGRISDMLNAADAWMLLVADDRAVWVASDLVTKWEAP